jgi:hypothetical protein
MFSRQSLGRWTFVVLATAAVIAFGLYYPYLDNTERLAWQRIALVCVAPLSLAMILTWVIMRAARR